MSNPWTPNWERLTGVVTDPVSGEYSEATDNIVIVTGSTGEGADWDYSGQIEVSGENAVANAALVLSAPALVEALEACLGLLTGNMDGDLPADRDPVEMARAALSLAKGTQGETK